MYVVNSITGETSERFMSDFFIEEVDWSDPENPIVTKTKLPFQIGCKLDKGVSVFEVTKLPKEFPLRKLLRTTCSVRILKGEKIRKVSMIEKAAKSRSKHMQELQCIKGLSFVKGRKNDKEFLFTPQDIILEDISIRKAGFLLTGGTINAPDQLVMINNDGSMGSNLRALVGTDKLNEGPSESTFSDVKANFATFDADQPEDAEEHEPPEVIEPEIDENGGEGEGGDPPLDDQGARRVTVEEIEEIITELGLTQEQRDKILGGGN